MTWGLARNVPGVLKRIERMTNLLLQVTTDQRWDRLADMARCEIAAGDIAPP